MVLLLAVESVFAGQVIHRAMLHEFMIDWATTHVVEECFPSVVGLGGIANGREDYLSGSLDLSDSNLASGQIYLAADSDDGFRIFFGDGGGVGCGHVWASVDTGAMVARLGGRGLV